MTAQPDFATFTEAMPLVYRRSGAPDLSLLAKKHLPLVRRIAWHVHGIMSSAIEIEDLVQIGLVALVEAAGAFEERGQVTFEQYLVTRVRGWINKTTCKQRYQHIQAFERMLSDEGIAIIKCYLHISKQEQKQRLQARMDDPDKHWKLQASDFEDRRLWKDFIKAYEDAMIATSSDYAPWYVIPADSKIYRDYFLMTLLVETLEGLKIKPPAASFDLKSARLD